MLDDISQADFPFNQEARKSDVMRRFFRLHCCILLFGCFHCYILADAIAS